MQNIFFNCKMAEHGCNSKVSSFLLQSLENLSNTDPDEGSCELTSALCENLVAQTKSSSCDKETLRESIEKITQLQLQLMSPHSSETDLLNGYSLKAPQSPMSKPLGPQTQLGTSSEVASINCGAGDSCELFNKKVDEMIKLLERRINVLNTAQTTIDETSIKNNELGIVLECKLLEKVRPIEVNKFRAYIENVGNITNLILCLSKQLVRAGKAWIGIAEEDAEKKTRELKYDRLFEQLEEAARLKEDIDRRGAYVTAMLQKNLSADEFASFNYFINMKVKLTTDAHNIADKIKYGKQRLISLKLLEGERCARYENHV